MTGADLIERLKITLSRGGEPTLNDRDLAIRLGVTELTMRVWRKSPELKAHQVANLVGKAVAAARVQAEREAIKPIVEFFPFDATRTNSGKKWELFNTRFNGEERDHPYLKGLREALDKASGVYLYFDSRGRALYSGKAERQPLWKEMNLALNRPRDVQRIRRVKHPESRVGFGSTIETRQIKSQAVELHELACYFSAYSISTNLIGEVESILISGFANDLLNVRMERFGGGPQEAVRRKKNRRIVDVSRRLGSISV